MESGTPVGLGVAVGVGSRVGVAVGGIGVDVGVEVGAVVTVGVYTSAGIVDWIGEGTFPVGFTPLVHDASIHPVINIQVNITYLFGDPVCLSQKGRIR